MVIFNFHPDVKKIALDTYLFIYVLEQHLEFSEKAKAILEEVENGVISAVASAVSLTEILIKPIREDSLNLEKQYKLLFTHFPNLNIISIDNSIAERAAYLRGTYSLKTSDALIVAIAIAAGAELFITNDLRLEQVKEVK